MTFASITISGTLNNKAEQRFTPNNTSVIGFYMNIDRYDSRSKEMKQHSVKVNLWGDNHAQYLDTLVSGAEVLVIGRPQIEQYTDRDGNNVRAFVVEANKINILGSSASASADFNADPSAMGFSSGPESSDFSSEEDMEIPF